MNSILEINSFLVAIFGVGIIGSIVRIYQLWKKSIEVKEGRQKIIDDRFLKLEKAQIAILHNKIYHQCTTYLDDGYISIDDLDDLNYMYRAYASLGGNGTGEHLYNSVKNLPNRKGDNIAK